MSVTTTSPSSKKYSREDLAELRKAFDAIDTDGSGALDLEEVTEFMRQCDLEPAFARLAMRLVDENGDNSVSFDEFSKFIELLSQIDDDPNIVFKMLFKAIDNDRNGYLDLEEIREFVNYFAPEEVKIEEIKNFVDTFDENGDGVLSLDELLTIIS